jgi:hypothetical protein
MPICLMAVASHRFIILAARITLKDSNIGRKAFGQLLRCVAEDVVAVLQRGKARFNSSIQGISCSGLS